MYVNVIYIYTSILYLCTYTFITILCHMFAALFHDFAIFLASSRAAARDAGGAPGAAAVATAVTASGNMSWALSVFVPQ